MCHSGTPTATDLPPHIRPSSGQPFVAGEPRQPCSYACILREEHSLRGDVVLRCLSFESGEF